MLMDTAMNCALNRQKGSALIVGMLLMIVLTLIGITTMRTTRLETMMATNAKESAIAFEAAEAAQRDAAELIEGSASVAAFNGANGLLGLDDADPDYNDPAVWTAADSREYSDTFPDVGSQPRYIIKYVGDVTNDASNDTMITGYTDSSGNPLVSLFRVTTRGTGRNDTASVVIQTYYGKIY